ncbi:hypothetical protein N2603_38310 [Bradyrhizobium huanghuaihaiense]|uniref:hypothetical protein n=1 Tax=Bradyrhizobium huanghuaihaiense TaxID=990078 RepID=UPI0021A9F433|nr:hypothetical protein [Bradyrhizobium sp. CB3035]UWU75775.1 hypothetical protein N2603_38310 [Bradyrhizobium sp. CB3035]
MAVRRFQVFPFEGHSRSKRSVVSFQKCYSTYAVGELVLSSEPMTFENCAEVLKTAPLKELDLHLAGARHRAFAAQALRQCGSAGELVITINRSATQIGFYAPSQLAVSENGSMSQYASSKATRIFVNVATLRIPPRWKHGLPATRDYQC